ncbi:putative ribosomal N-acetyltransferase YdaF [Actinomadura rubteroloni]|uniref:Putative ribosomal N-acetyltransferase YdaF n=2 Tax=Actinomadura rubteroloni TaxID=1926885 RepID=A0A2P4UBC7_9ACTN|nr:putative ribosomal N-acetyltransferase YdaF [Actinomadura rubteroloni]
MHDGGMDAAPLTDRPPERIVLDDLVVRRWRPSDAGALDQAVKESFAELHEWMAWAADLPAEADHAAYLAERDRLWADGTEFAYGIFAAGGDRDGAPVLGGTVLHVRPPVTCEIGYWVHSAYTGRGIATRVAAALVRAAFADPGVERVEIRCDAANDSSASVARRLGFLLERTVERPPAAPGDTGRDLCWLLTPDDLREGRARL